MRIIVADLLEYYKDLSMVKGMLVGTYAACRDITIRELIQRDINNINDSMENIIKALGKTSCTSPLN